MRAAFGQTGGALISLMVAVAALTSINATMIVGARTNYAVGRDWPVLGRLGQLGRARGTPHRAMRVPVRDGAAAGGGGRVAGGGFKAMVEFTAPVFWLFFLLAGAVAVRAARARAAGASGRSRCRCTR